MTAKELVSGGYAANTEPKLYTLAPILDDGPDVLDVHDVPGMEDIRLCELELVYEDALHRTAILRADNLLDPAAPEIPHGPRLIRASFEFKTPAAAQPHAVDISPPASLALECSDDFVVVNDWLIKRHFFASRDAAA